MTHGKRRRLYFGGVFLGGSLFGWQFWRGYEAVSQSTMRLAEPTQLGVACSAVGLAFTVQIVAWAYVMRGLRVRLAWQRVFPGYLQSFIPRYIPGTVWGYLSRNEWLYQFHHVRYSIATLGSVLEIVLGVVTACTIALMYVAVRMTDLSRYALGLLAVCLPVVAWFVLNYVLRSLGWQRHIPDKAGIGEPIFLLWRAWCVPVALYLLLWCCYGVALAATAQAFNVRLDASLLNLSAAFSMAWLAGLFVIIVPSGLGVRELVLTGYLMNGVGIPLEQASLISIILRFVTLIAELALLFGVVVVTRCGFFKAATTLVSADGGESGRRVGGEED